MSGPPLLDLDRVDPAAVVAALADGRHATCALDRWPGGNAGLPDLLALLGITEVIADAPPGFPSRWRWRGSGGAVVSVVDPGAPPEGQVPAPLHVGAVPSGRTVPQDPPPASDPAAETEAADAAAPSLHNPLWLPVQTGCPCPLPPGTASVRDDLGARYPVQASDDGPLVAPRLEPGGTRTLYPESDSCPGARWETSDRVLDNGRLRAELTPAGTLGRLVVDGRFALLSDAWLAPRPTRRVQPRFRVVADGPVRSEVVIDHGEAVLRLRLHVDRPWLEVTALDGDGVVELSHRHGWRDAQAAVAYTLGGGSVASSPSLLVPSPPAIEDPRAVVIGGDDHHPPLSLACPDPSLAEIADGLLRIRLALGARYLIGGGDLDQAVAAAHQAQTPPTLVDPASVTPLPRVWGDPPMIHPLPDAADGSQRFCAVEGTGRERRWWLDAPRTPPRLVDGAGRLVGHQPTERPEEGGWELRSDPWSVAILVLAQGA